MKISEIILEWYKKNKRSLPWRETSDPYRIWLSEIILQQTRVSQGLEYYQRFVARFPDVQTLAAAGEQEVIKLWQGLGYYSRARNLLAAAGQVEKEFGGTFPSRYADLLKLKGVGPYTAAAVASIAFGEPVAVVDGNVSRVLARLFAVQDPVNLPEGAKQVGALAGELLNRDDPGNHNQAMMEFGALQCVPVNPGCHVCPVQQYCQALSRDLVAVLPVKQKKAAVRKRYFTYLVIREGEHTYITRRTGNDIWKEMYEFPLIEHDTDPGEEEIIREAVALTGLQGERLIITGLSEPVRHQLTHRMIIARFLHLETDTQLPGPPAHWKRVRFSEVNDHPLPRLIDRYLELNGESPH
jgi:A/G-specific adenine glycosylase